MTTAIVSTPSQLSASSVCVTVSFVALSGTACTKGIENKTKFYIFNLFVRFKKHFDNNEIRQGWPLKEFMQEILLIC
jgi:hypothetical protein